jgi:hypothetical protein
MSTLLVYLLLAHLGGVVGHILLEIWRQIVSRFIRVRRFALSWLKLVRADSRRLLHSGRWGDRSLRLLLTLRLPLLLSLLLIRILRTIPLGIVVALLLFRHRVLLCLRTRYGYTGFSTGGEKLCEVVGSQLEVTTLSPVPSPRVATENGPLTSFAGLVLGDSSQTHAVAAENSPDRTDISRSIGLGHLLVPIHADHDRAMHDESGEDVVDGERPAILLEVAHLLDHLGPGQNRRAVISLSWPVIELLSPVIDGKGVYTCHANRFGKQLMRPAESDTRSLRALVQTFRKLPPPGFDRDIFSDELSNGILKVSTIPSGDAIKYTFHPSLLTRVSYLLVAVQRVA